MSKFSRIAIWYRSRVTTVVSGTPDPTEPEASEEHTPPEPVTFDTYRTERDSALNRLFGQKNKKQAQG
jgi:hypothetical protein